MFGGHLGGFRSQSIPESFVGFDRSAGVQAFLKKSLQLFLRSFETGSGGDLHCCDGRVQSFFSGRIGAGVNNRLDFLFLLRSELDGHRGESCDARLLPPQYLKLL